MLVTHHSPQLHQPLLPPTLPRPGPPLFHSNPHARSISTPSLSDLPLVYHRGYPHPHAHVPVHAHAFAHVDTRRPPLSRSSSLRKSAHEKDGSDKAAAESETDELEDDDEEEGQHGDTEDAFMANQQSRSSASNRKGKAGDSPSSARSGDKRRRTRASLNHPSGSSPNGGPGAISDHNAPGRNRPGPIKPVGFAAGRESRRQSDNYDPAIPSPVVMGFDYQSLDEKSMKTVRETISIREQQQALIAQRRQDALGANTSSSSATAKDLEIRPWNPEDAARKQGKAFRPPRDPGALLTVSTAHSDKDIVLASRSAPMGSSLAAQQASRDQPVRPINTLPPIQARPGPVPGPDPRTAPIDRIGEPSERPQFFRPSNGRYEVPHTARPAIGGDRRSFASHIGGQNGHERPHGSASPPRSGHHFGGAGADRSSAARREFLAPFERMYDILSQTESHKYALQDLHHRYETALTVKQKEIGDFKSTAQAATTLLNNLQQSADSLKDMVRYEISRAAPPAPPASGRGGLSADERKEFEDMKVRMKKLEEALAARSTGGEPPAKRRKGPGSTAGSEA